MDGESEGCGASSGGGRGSGPGGRGSGRLGWLGDRSRLGRSRPPCGTSGGAGMRGDDVGLHDHAGAERDGGAGVDGGGEPLVEMDEVSGVEEDVEGVGGEAGVDGVVEGLAFGSDVERLEPGGHGFEVGAGELFGVGAGFVG